MRRIVAHAPVRLDLGGGWTDVPPYSDEEGGFVCNIAIARYATATCTAASGRSVDDAQEQHDGEAALAHAALRRSSQFGEASPPSLELRSDFPIGAGLGGSSAAGVAAIGALLDWHGRTMTRSEIAELSRSVEVEDLGVAGGRQDHYAAAHGGALGLGFSRGSVSVEPISLSPARIAEIERRFILAYTGKSRISGATITAVLDAYRERQHRVVSALHRMRELARAMPQLLADGSLDDLGEVIGEQWEEQRSLHPLITTPLIDRIIEVGRGTGALGGKALGASGGGCVLLLAAEGAVDGLRNAIAQLAQVLPFSIDLRGLRVDAGQG